MKRKLETQITLNTLIDSFSNEIKTLSKVNAYECYQCGKCTAGCSVGDFLEETPNQMMRLIQLNLRDEALNSKTPFLCATCNTCTARCPMDIDIAKVMETIRILSEKEKKKNVKEVSKFSKIFLDSIKNHGRLFELGLTARFNIENKTPFKDSELAPTLIFKGKLSLLPQKIKNRKRIKKIFDNSINEKKGVE